MILLIDNYDSFVHNLARYFQQLGQETVVVRNDLIDAVRVRQVEPAAIVLSPGPCTPRQAGASIELVQQVYRKTPLLGICLGHQTIAEAFGGRTVRAPEPVHGRASLVEHNERGIFAGLPNPLAAGRYHSLTVEELSLPAELEVTARTSDGLVMAISHRDFPVVGLQFHPESILTDCGFELLAAFLRLAGVNVPKVAISRSKQVAEFSAR